MDSNNTGKAKFRRFTSRLALGAAPLLALCAVPMQADAGGFEHGRNSIELTPLGTFATGEFDEGAAEIVAYDPETERLFVVNGFDATIDVLDISDPNNPQRAFQIEVTAYDASDKTANSVAVHGDMVAAAVENTNKQAPGAVLFFDTDGNFLKRLVVGDMETGTNSALPDMVTFSPDGDWVLVANEGEPNDDYTIDPEGSVSIIDLSDGLEEATVTNVDFRAFNGMEEHLDPSIRIFGPGATVAQDLEPEYIAVSDDSETAWVAIQENNAIATIDIEDGRVTHLTGLGFKDHSTGTNTLDASNEDGLINLAPWPVNGMYQPDAMVSFEVDGQTYLITANEGDAREYLGTPGFEEEARVGGVTLDPDAFPNRDMLQEEANLGRLKITNTIGDTDGDGEYEELYSFGARSFSIWSAGRGDDEDERFGLGARSSSNRDSGHVSMVFDSGDVLERITAAHFPDDFNSTNDENGSFDDRSDDKGPEPEGLAVGEVAGRTYAFVGLERIGGIAVFDVSEPREPVFVQYINTRDFHGNPVAVTPDDPAPAGDLAPEGLAFISAKDSPIDRPLLAVAFEVSGTTTIFAIDEVVAEHDTGRVLCNGTLTGTFNRVIAVPGGTCVLSAATVYGGVRAAPGSTLFIYGGEVYGNVRSNPGSSVVVLSSFVGGNIRCNGAEAPSGCQVSGATVYGGVRSLWAQGGMVNIFSNDIVGNVRVSGNAVQSLISRNTVGRNLACRGNSPAPNPGGMAPTNDVYGHKRNQCDESSGF